MRLSLQIEKYNLSKSLKVNKMSKLRPNPKKDMSNVKTKPSNDLIIGHPSIKEKKSRRTHDPDFVQKESKNTHSTERKVVDAKREAKRIEKEKALEVARAHKEDQEREKYLRSLDSFDSHDINHLGEYQPKKKSKFDANNKVASSYQQIDLKLLAYYAKFGYPMSWLATQFNCSASTLQNMPYVQIIRLAHNNYKTAILHKTGECALAGSSKHTQIILDKMSMFANEEKGSVPIEFNVRFINSDGSDA